MAEKRNFDWTGFWAGMGGKGDWYQQQRLLEKQQSERQGAAESYVMSDPTLRTAVGMNPGSAQSRGFVAGLASSDPGARSVAGAAAGNLQDQRAAQASRLGAERQAYTQSLEDQKKQLDIEAKVLENRNLQMTGGRQLEPWITDYRSVGDFGTALGAVSDLRVMNQELGAEKFPGTAKGLYETKRTYLINQMGKMFDAGAMSSEEIKFYGGYIPDFTEWTSWSKDYRDAQLRTLSGLLTAKTKGIVDTTPGTSMPEVRKRSIAEIMGEPPAPVGAEPVRPAGMVEALQTDMENDIPGSTEFLKRLGGIISRGFSESRGP